MLSFSAVKKYSDDDWRIVGISWGAIELITSIADLASMLSINSDELRTELIRNWNGYSASPNIKFQTQEAAMHTIEDYLQPMLTANILARDN